MRRIYNRFVSGFTHKSLCGFIGWFLHKSMRKPAPKSVGNPACAFVRCAYQFAKLKSSFETCCAAFIRSAALMPIRKLNGKSMRKFIGGFTHAFAYSFVRKPVAQPARKPVHRGFALAYAFAFVMAASVLLAGCSGIDSHTGIDVGNAAENSTDPQGSAGFASEPPEISGLAYESSMKPAYAEGFDIHYYSDGYTVIDVRNQRYLLVPEGMPMPRKLPQGMTAMQKPVQNIYLAASSAMALFNAIDALDHIRFSGTDKNGWQIEAAAAAMEEGRIAFAGKYSAPDYEALAVGNCGLAIESTMIMHSPEVKEKIEELGISVFIDYSSYESHPLGRTEWIRLYGAMVDKQEEADAFFAQQEQILAGLETIEETEKTVAFFFINAAGQVSVRTSGDYIPKMIELAGGRYVFDDLENTENKMASVKISMEQFYEKAADADYLIYNAAIENPLRSIKELEEKSSLFREFKAVKKGNVWTTDKYMYQASDLTGEMIRDIHTMLMGGSGEEMMFLMKVE